MARYKNLEPFDDSFRSFLKWVRTRARSAWPEWRDFPPQPAPPSRVEGALLRATFINHATVLLQWRGLNFLTDPHFSLRASPFSFIGPRRAHAPGIPYEDLPRIHAILLTHDHYDHMDITSLRRLTSGQGCPIYTGLGVAGQMPRDLRRHATEMDWWEHLPLAPGLKLHFVPAQHFSARGIFDRMKTLWGGFVLESAQGNIYAAGDTARGRHFGMLKERFGCFRLALLPIGAYEPRWFMAKAHLNPEEAVNAMLALKAEHALAIHFGCFHLADEEMDAPLDALKVAVEKGLGLDTFRVLMPGEGWDINLEVEK